MNTHAIIAQQPYYPHDDWWPKKDSWYFWILVGFVVGILVWSMISKRGG